MYLATFYVQTFDFACVRENPNQTAVAAPTDGEICDGASSITSHGVFMQPTLEEGRFVVYTFSSLLVKDGFGCVL